MEYDAGVQSLKKRCNRVQHENPFPLPCKMGIIKYRCKEYCEICNDINKVFNISEKEICCGKKEGERHCKKCKDQH